MSYSIYNTVGNVYNTFGFVNEVAETVFDISNLENEFRLRDACRAKTIILYKARTRKNTRTVQLYSTVVVKKIVRRHSARFSPWVSTEEKRLLEEAQCLGIKMFRRV